MLFCSETNEDAEDQDIKLRQINCELLPLTRADGSAFLTQGETAVLASMSGPVEAKLSNQQIDCATLEVSYRPKSGLPTIKDRLRETMIKSICETAIITALYPRTAITVQIQEMENKSGLEACAVNAACLALLVGGIPMKFTVAAIHCIVDKNDKIIVDPDDKESVGCKADFTFVVDSLHHNLVAVNTSGKFNLSQFNDALTLSKAASEIIFQFYKKIMKKFLSAKT